MPSTQPGTSSAAAGQKKRRACDECRSRKLACSKEPGGCGRCRREGLACVYSAQKPMGRPRKRPRAGNDEAMLGARGQAAGSADVQGSLGGSFAGLGLGPGAGADVDVDVDVDAGSFSLFDLFGFGDGNLDPLLLQQLPDPGPLPPAGLSAGPAPPLPSSLLPPPRQSTGAALPQAPQAFQKFLPTSLFAQTFPSIDYGPVGTSASGGGSSGHGANSTRASPETATATTTTATTPASTQSQDGPDGPDGHDGHDGRPAPARQQQRWAALIDAVPRMPTADAYNKASAAWLLTAPNRACGCLARLYLALDSLQSLPAEVGAAMGVARNAAHTAHDTALCPSCSPPAHGGGDARCAPPVQAYQNLMVLVALLPSIAHAYGRIVQMVDEEAARAAAAHERLPLTLAAYGGTWGYMARWDAPCQTLRAAGRTPCTMDPPLWRLVVRTMLRMDVYGIHLDEEDAAACDATAGSNGGAAPASAGAAALGPRGRTDGGAAAMVPVHFGLRDIAEMMESRARMRHASEDGACDAACNAGPRRTASEHAQCGCTALPPGELHHCQRVIAMAKAAIDRLVIV